MKELSLDFAYALAMLCVLVVLFDALPRVGAYLRRMRRARGGVFGVVVDRRGEVLGTYVDPFGHPWRAPRVHDRESPWVRAPGPDGQGWAWEGFGRTEEEAYMAANRLRRRHLRLLPWLTGDGDDDQDSFSYPTPFAPRSE
jgi:hypothetical protein